MHFSASLGDGIIAGVGPTTTVTAAGPGQVITIQGGPNATAPIPGAHQDPADLYGIVIVLIAIAVAIVAARWLFGRTGGRPGGSVQG